LLLSFFFLYFFVETDLLAFGHGSWTISKWVSRCIFLFNIFFIINSARELFFCRNGSWTIL